MSVAEKMDSSQRTTYGETGIMRISPATKSANEQPKVEPNVLVADF